MSEETKSSSNKACSLLGWHDFLRGDEVFHNQKQNFKRQHKKKSVRGEKSGPNKYFFPSLPLKKTTNKLITAKSRLVYAALELNVASLKQLN